MTKKIRSTKLGLIAMPENYSPALVTQHDLEHDSQLCPARAELEQLEASSIQLQEMARDTAAIGFEGEAAESREQQAQDDLAALEDAWTAALEAADEGDAITLEEHLLEAQTIEQDWGDDSQARRALAMLEAAS